MQEATNIKLKGLRIMNQEKTQIRKMMSVANFFNSQTKYSCLLHRLPQQPNRRSDQHQEDKKRLNVRHVTQLTLTFYNWPASPFWCLFQLPAGWRDLYSSPRLTRPSASCPWRGAGPSPTWAWRPRSSRRSAGRPGTSGLAAGTPHRTRSSIGPPGAAITRVLYRLTKIDDVFIVDWSNPRTFLTWQQDHNYLKAFIGGQMGK